MVAAIILAAGRSTRMGRSKPLLPYGGTPGHTFVSRLLEVLKVSGISQMLVVGRPEDVLLQAEVTRWAGCYIANPRADEGQLSSLLVGLSYLRSQADAELDGALVIPADAPLISPAVVTRLLGAVETSAARIVRATHGGKHGHPVFFRHSTFDELQAADPAVGARAVVRADPSRVLDVDMDDVGVTIDFDTPEEYRRYFGEPPPVDR